MANSDWTRNPTCHHGVSFDVECILCNQELKAVEAAHNEGIDVLGRISAMCEVWSEEREHYTLTERYELMGRAENYRRQQLILLEELNAITA
jgi:hypothetical protein